MFEYDKDACNVAKELDKIDFTDSLNDCYDNGVRNYYDIVDCLIEKFPEIYEYIEELSTDEFIEYLNKRYGVWFNEITTNIMANYAERKEIEDD